MSDLPTHNADYCSGLVRQNDEDRWLTTAYAPSEFRRALMALGAFQVELRRIPGAVSEPPLGEIRLQWWRDAFAEIRQGQRSRAHPVVQEIEATGLADEKYKQMIELVIDASARPLYAQSFIDVAELTDWLHQADGTFDALVFQLVGGEPEQINIVQEAGAAFALAREGQGLAPQLGSAVHQKAVGIHKDASPQLSALPSAISSGLLHLSLTPLYAARAGKPFPIAKRVRLFTAMAFGRF